MQTLTYLNPFRGREMECQNLVITCIDFRFRRQLEHMMFRAGYQDFDLLAVQGGANAVIDEVSRPVIISAIAIAVERHHIRSVSILDHIDCGAFGGSAAFQSSEEEEQFHLDKLREASEIIKQAYPFLEVNIMYVDWEKLQVF